MMDNLSDTTNCISYPLSITYGIDAYFFENHPNKVFLVGSESDLESRINQFIDGNIRFCIRGSGTGYAGAAVVLDENEYIIVTTKLNNIRKINNRERYVLLEPGVINFELDEYLKQQGLRYPPDPASYKSCTIAGNVATNAGGPHCFLYGVTANYIHRVKLFSLRHRKFVTLGALSPYSLINDLKSIFIGSEGTLGVFSDIVLKVRTKPPVSYTYLISFDHYSKSISFINELLMSGVIPAVLDMSTDPYHTLYSNQKSVKLLLAVEGGNFFVNESIEIIKKLTLKYADSVVEGDADKVMDVRSKLVKHNVIATLGLSKKPQYFLFDAVVPRSELGPILEYLYYLADQLEIFLMNTFHAGDGNIHPTVYYDPQNQEDMSKLEFFWYSVLKKVVAMRGVITGEHGIGIEKIKLYSAIEDKNVLKISKIIKNYFDPTNILSWGKFIDESELSQKYINNLEVRLRNNNLDVEMKSDSTISGDQFQNDLLSGVIEISCYTHPDDINSILALYGFKIPYVPIAFVDQNFLFFNHNNIPNFFGHLYELPENIMGFEAWDGSKKTIIGKKVLKNVSGYSLKLLAGTNIIGVDKAYYIKVMSEMGIKKQYVSFHFETSDTSFLDEILNQHYTFIENFIIHKKDIYECSVVIYNDSHMISLFTQLLEDKNIRFHLNEGVQCKPLNSPKIYIISFVTSIERVLKYSFIPEYIYLFHGRTLVAADINELITNELIDENVESIREIDRSGNKYVYLSETLKAQLNITDDLISNIQTHLASEIHVNRDANISKNPIKSYFESNNQQTVFQEIKKCSRCGLCLFNCPQYMENREEHNSLRGIILLLKNNIFDHHIDNFFNNCKIKCKEKYMCQENCPTGVIFDEIYNDYQKKRDKKF